MALELRRRGYRASALLGGLAGWIEAGLPTEPKRVERGRTLADVCPDCGQPLVRRVGRYGPFVSCSGYPGCKYVKREPKAPPKVTDVACPECGRPMVERIARKGKNAGQPFLGCSGYPKCKHTQQIAGAGEGQAGGREQEKEAVPA